MLTIRLPWGLQQPLRCADQYLCGSRAQHSGTRGKRESPFGSAFGVIIGIYLVQKRGLLQGETLRKQHWKPITFLSLVDKETLFRLLPVYWDHPSYICIYIYMYNYVYIYIYVYIYMYIYIYSIHIIIINGDFSLHW